MNEAQSSGSRSEESENPLVDRYRRFLEGSDVQALGKKLKGIEHQLWFEGSPPIFSAELREVRERGARRRQESGGPDLLILCVGHSPEPLLLAVAHHAEVEVILLIEQNLEEEPLRVLEKLWNKHYTLLGVPAYGQVEKRQVKGDAADLFITVREIVEKRQDSAARIVLDITGAKKSMIAGAFLAAGFLDLESSYVDFDQYDDAILRRPVPGTSRPGRLQHPYSLFKLQEENQLKEELDRRRFREAERLAGELREMAASPEVKELLKGSAMGTDMFEALQRVSNAYGLWSEGFYAEAADATVPGVPVAATVECLGKVWPRTSDSSKAIIQALSSRAVFADPVTALAYFLDVLVWNGEARIQNRPRDVFLRLYGTLESVITFALYVFVGRHPERLQVSSRGELDDDRIAELRSQTLDVCEKSSAQALKVLRGKSFEISPEGLEGSEDAEAVRSQTCAVALSAPALSQELDGSLFKGKGGTASLWDFADLRHKAVHWLAPVPKEEALRLLQYYRTVLQTLVPVVLGWFRKDSPDLDPAAGERLDEWEGRLLDAAGGRIPADCQPLSYKDLMGRLKPA